MICLNVSKIVPKALLYVVAGMELALSLEKLVNEKLLNLHSVKTISLILSILNPV